MRVGVCVSRVSGTERAADVEYIWCKVNDQRSRAEHLYHALTRAKAVLNAGGTVIVHCEQGKHRTGMFCSAVAVGQHVVVGLGGLWTGAACNS